MTTRSITRALFLAALVTASQVTGAVSPTLRRVTSNVDGAPGSLRALVAVAEAGDTIQFDMTQVTSQIDLPGGQIVIDKDLTIRGPGRGLLTLRNTLSGSRVVLVLPGVTATISGLTLTGGNVASEPGGGILNRGTLTLSYATVTGNGAESAGGIANASGALTVAYSTVSSNSAARGGGIGTYSDGHGTPTVTVTHSTIAGNRTTPGSGSDGGGILHAGGPLTVVNSTVSGNSAEVGGGIYSYAGVLTIVNATVSGNTAQLYGGLSTNAATTTLQNTILANNLGGDCYLGGASRVNATHSLIEDGSCLHAPFGTYIGNLTGDPGLSPLQDNGGPTWTHKLLAGSPAIDAGLDVLAVDEFGAPLAFDQRGTLPRLSRNHVDIGAFERLGCTLGSYATPSGCVQADAGFYAGDEAEAPTACLPGFFQPDAGQPSCILAEPGFYAPGPGATGQLACPAGMTSPAGATAASACTPPPFTFTGFFEPVDNFYMNRVKAGQAIPVKFSLGGYQGLNIFAAGFPSSTIRGCDVGLAADDVEETVTAVGNSLTYDATTDRYTYVWKTAKAWANTCRTLTVTFRDGTTKRAEFDFRK